MEINYTDTEIEINLDKEHLEFLRKKNIDISELVRLRLDVRIAEEQLNEAQEKLNALFKRG